MNLLRFKAGGNLLRNRRLLSRGVPPIEQQRVTEAAIVGLPNAGKSSLLNALLAKRVAAVSRKRNTTRENLLAVASDSSSGVQVAFYDTPGFVGHRVGGDSEEKLRVERSVMTSARTAVSSEDNTVTLVVIDAAKNLTGLHKAQLKDLLAHLVREACGREKAKGLSSTELAKDVASCFTIVLNKIDLVNPKYNLLPLTEELLDLFKEVVWSCVPSSKKKVSLTFDCFYVSASASDALTNGLSELRDFLHQASISRPWDTLDDEEGDPKQTLRSGKQSSAYDSVDCELDDVTFASECIREKIFTYVHKEVPYSVTQENRIWEMCPNGTLRIQTDLVVKSRSQKKMVIGPKGEILQLISQAAERDLSDHFGLPVELKLWVRERGISKA